MVYQPHLYLICYPNLSLVASQLPAAEFVRRYSYGSTSYYSGKMILAEIDVNYRNPYFKIDEALEKLHPHEDGTPKASKYICSYRALEHVDSSAIKCLYLVNADATFYTLYPGEYKEKEKTSDVHVYSEIAPLTMLSISRQNALEFGREFTRENEFIRVPRLLYMELNLDFDRFLKSFQDNPFAPPPIEGIHPAKLRDAILELRNRPGKNHKGLTLHSALSHQSFRIIKNGIWLMDEKTEVFFPMPELHQIESENLPFYRSM